MEAVKTWTYVVAEFAEPQEDWGAIASIFEDHGILGTVEEASPPGLGGYAHDAGMVEALAADLMFAGATQVRTEEVQEEDWAETWKRFFKPTRIGNRFLIRPEWESADAQGLIEIVLNPGQAFGTGDHPTTRMCLQLLEELELAGKSVADIGCGSGILTVAAKLLGAAQVDAIDNDPPSIEATHQNLALNQVQANIILGTGFEPLKGEHDVVVSNIISATLIRIAGEAAEHVKPGGYWVTSGIIQANWPDVRAAAERAGFRLVKEVSELEWVGAIFQR